MNHKGLLGGFYRLSEWIMKLAYVNLLWIGFTLLGGVLFGFMPATVSLYTIIRKWLHDEDNFNVWKLFWSTYRKNFVHSNLIGIFYIIVAGILFIYFQNTHLIPNKYIHAFQIFLYAFVIAYIISVVFLFPVIVQYSGNFLQYIKNALIIGLAYPHYAIYMILLFGGFMTLFLFIPSLILFFGGSLLAFLSMKIASRIFIKIEVRQSVKANHQGESVV